MFPNLIWLSSCPVYAPTEILQLNLVTKEIQELQETLTLYCVTEDFFFSCLQKESRSNKKHKENKEQAVNSIDSSTNKHLCLNTFLIWAAHGAGVLCLSPKLPWGWNRHAEGTTALHKHCCLRAIASGQCRPCYYILYARKTDSFHFAPSTMGSDGSYLSRFLVDDPKFEVIAYDVFIKCNNKLRSLR